MAWPHIKYLAQSESLAIHESHCNSLNTCPLTHTNTHLRMPCLAYGMNNTTFNGPPKRKENINADVDYMLLQINNLH